MNTLTITFTPCTPAPANGYRVFYRPVGSSISYRTAPTNFTTSPAVIFDNNDADGTQYEGYMESDCGNDNFGVHVNFSTLGGSCANVTNLQIMTASQTSATVIWNTVAGATGYLIYAVRVSDGFQLGTQTEMHPNITYNGLQPNTQYNLFVRTLCAGGGTSSGTSVQFTSASAAVINGNTSFNNTQNTGNGTITAPAGQTVTVTLSCFNYSGSCTVSMNIAGVTTTGSTNVTNGNTSFTFVMPTGGTVNWTATFTTTNGGGGGGITVA